MVCILFLVISFHKMLMLAGIVVVHITTIILLLVATIDNVSIEMTGSFTEPVLKAAGFTG